MRKLAEKTIYIMVAPFALTFLGMVWVADRIIEVIEKYE